MFEILASQPGLLYHISLYAAQIFGIGSASLSILAFLPYARDTILGRTEPQRASWLIWSVLSTISLMSQIAEGATASLWFVTIQCGGTVTIFLLSIFHGSGDFFRKGDFFVLVGAASGLVLWAATENAVYALGISIAISLLGGIATIRKAYANPDSETVITWAISFIATCFALASVGELDWVLLAYPIYLFVLYGAIVLAIEVGRRRKTAPQQQIIQFKSQRSTG